MSDQLYNLIMASVPSFYPSDTGEFTIPISRFLEYTEDHLKKQFQALDQVAIIRLKNLPTIFATEEEAVDARIGKITDIQVYSSNLRVKYSFDKDRYPLTRGVLKENRQKLGISESAYEFHRGHWAVKECNLYDFYDEYLRSITGVAHKLKNADKKVQLIYAFNGTGKTRLSRRFKDVIAPKNDEAEDQPPKVIYYNAFTEDLFYWDNDLEGDADRKLKIHPNAYTRWILEEQGQDRNAIAHFQRYTSDKLTPKFSADFSEVIFTFERGNEEKTDNVKISKGEESNFIWSIFYSLIEQVIATLNIADASERETDRYNQLEYVFIDDPVSSLDENHLIELAVNVAALIKSSRSDLKFIMTTHNPLFYNVLHNELNHDDKEQGYKAKEFEKYRLEKQGDGAFQLEKQPNDSPFSYHLYLISEIKGAIETGQLKKYHFNFLRNILEKTSTFLGYKKWGDLLPQNEDGTPNPYMARIINISSHSKHSGDEVASLTDDDKRVLGYLVKHLTETYRYWNLKAENNG